MLSNLKNTHRARRACRRVGRGIGSGAGRTCGRGQKGQGSRAGSGRRYGYEGGQFRLYMKMPIRGFSNERFRKKLDTINLNLIEKMFEEGDVVSLAALKERGFIKGKSYGLKILGYGDLKKKVKIEAVCVSDAAKQKLQQANIEFTIV